MERKYKIKRNLKKINIYVNEKIKLTKEAGSLNIRKGGEERKAEIDKKNLNYVNQVK